jgi:cell fate (sporulation/competence/biofilm development) regulator YlbF (YheA/YmcA/DUF963 family)
MDVIQAARELGRAIQADQRYKEYQIAKAANDADSDLQEKINEFTRIRQELHMEMSKSEKDNEKIQTLNRNMQDAYNKVMQNHNMANFVIVKSAMDKLINEVNGIVSLCCEGEDPDTCQYTEGCSGSCSGCSGCG